MNSPLARGCLAVALACCGGRTDSQSASWNQCNDLPAPSVQYPQSAGVGPAPAPQGGTIEPGTYDLTDQTSYGASYVLSESPPETYVFDATTFRGISLDYAADEGNWSTSGTTLTLAYGCLCKVASGCQTPGPSSFGYTATPTQLVYFETLVNGGTTLTTFTKR